MSFFLRKLFYGAVLVDVNVQAKHVTLTSKCHCCRMQPQRESMEHLFLWSEVAQEVWRKLSTPFNMVHSYSSLVHLWSVWLDDANHRGQDGMCRIVMFGFACWELWRARCRAIFEDEQMRPMRIYQLILRQVCDMFLLF